MWLQLVTCAQGPFKTLGPHVCRLAQAHGCSIPLTLVLSHGQLLHRDVTLRSGRLECPAGTASRAAPCCLWEEVRVQTCESTEDTRTPPRDTAVAEGQSSSPVLQHGRGLPDLQGSSLPPQLNQWPPQSYVCHSSSNLPPHSLSPRKHNSDISPRCGPKE